MNTNYKKVLLGDVVKINSSSYSTKDNLKYVNYLDTGNITDNVIDEIQKIDLSVDRLPSRAKRKVKYNSIIYSTVRPNQRHFGIIKEQPENFLVSTGFAVIDVIEELVDADFIYYWLTQNKVVDLLHAIAEQSVSAYPSIKPSNIENLEIFLPELSEQKKIASILNVISKKMVVNNSINSNLEQQMQAIFVKMFGESIDTLGDCDTTLSGLVESVDNRGKTPPLSPDVTDYPIIDVRALSGSSRIIDYNNCSKFVDEETYNNWFRSGHPQPYDILISTVGSLAEMKLFLGNIGCIAQNVVGFRCKQISPLYIYQYLNYIKNDLVAYNIGSVQPSIKVTHIIKHHIFLPDKCEIDKFDEIARDMTNQIYANCKEIENLTQLRDTLLPKLMSGEIDLSNIDI